MKTLSFLFLTGILAGGCRPVVAAENIKAGGATFSFPSANLEQETIDNDNFTIKTNAYNFEFRAGLMTLNGKPMGTAHKGDAVVVHTDGTISINGAKQ